MSNKLKIDLKKETISFGDDKGKKKSIKKNTAKKNNYYNDDGKRKGADFAVGSLIGLIALIVFWNYYYNLLMESGLSIDVIMMNVMLFGFMSVIAAPLVISYLGRKYISIGIVGVLLIPFILFGGCMFLVSTI